MRERLRRDTWLRAVALGVVVYALVTAVYFALAAPNRLREHTPFNHFALLAEAWLAGRLDLGGPPPSYALNNDFARFADRWYVAFPAFPAVLLLPLVKVAGSAVRVQDGQFFLWLAGVAPAVLFLALEKLRRTGRSPRTTADDFHLALLFAFGTVYFFTALQGTVWFAAHVVGTALAALYLLFALDAARPFLAGLCLALALHTRVPIMFAAPLFLLEAWRVARRPVPLGGGLAQRVDLADLGVRLAAFSFPIAVGLAVAAWHNHARFGAVGEFGYQYLTVGWQARMQKWGLFDYHYLGRNLAVVLAGLPWFNPPPAPPLQINAHGLALWFTTPLYLWLLWPRRTGALHRALCWTALAVALPSLLYQNTGWIQFGQRFSNDYAVFLFALLAVGGRRWGAGFVAAALFAVAVNTFGAVTFDRAGRFYHQDASQKILVQPD